MKFIVQRVSSAACRVDDEVTGSIQKGFMVLIGISDSDTKEIADKMIKKLIGLRIFEDSEGKTNLSLKDVNGSLLLISQFTYMQIAGRETGHLLQMPVNRTWQKNFITILLRAVKIRLQL